MRFLFFSCPPGALRHPWSPQGVMPNRLRSQIIRLCGPNRSPEPARRGSVFVTAQRRPLLISSVSLVKGWLLRGLLEPELFHRQPCLL